MDESATGSTRISTGPALRPVLERFMDAWNAHDVEGVLSFCTEDVLWTQPGLAAPARGRDAAAAALRDAFTAFPDITWPKEDLRVYSGEDDTRAATSWTLVGTFKGRMEPGFAPTGKRVRVEGACLYELRDGKIARHTILYDSTAAMQQIGLLPETGSLAFKAQMHLQSLGGRLRGLVRR